MGSIAHQVVQAEFFFIKNNHTPEEVMHEAYERLQEGSRIKIVARFHDQTGNLSRLVQELHGHEDRLTAEITSFEHSSRWNRWLRTARITRFLRKRDVLRSKTFVEVRSDFVAALTQENGVAIEDFPGDPFRLVERNEIYELKQSLSFSNHVWVFVYEPVDLSSDEVSIVSSVWI